MRIVPLALSAVFALASVVGTRGQGGAPVVPNVDHHQHLPSAAATALFNRTRPGAAPVPPPTAEHLIELLDAAGIKRAVLLSTAYWFGSDQMPRADGDEYEHVRAENDWTIQQAERFPNRLIPFCSVNPLRPYAIDEIARCARQPSVRGLKIHNGNSNVDLLNPVHVERLRAVFRAADAEGLAIVIHLWSGEDYGRAHAEIFLQQVLPVASQVPVQIAHFAGAGPGYTDAALGVFSDAIMARDPSATRLFFDVAGVANFQPAPVLARLARRIREVGPERVVFGTDVGTPSENWAIFRRTVPLTEDEFSTVARNVVPYLDRERSRTSPAK